jgi:hypothetical protein
VRVSGLRLSGLLLFLPVPVVLVLFTQMPLGVRTSVALGVVVMLTHRLYARPFALRHADERCLWCGGLAGAGPALRVAEPGAETRWRTCGEAHRGRLAGTLGWAARHAGWLRLGIGGGLVVFLLSALAGGRPDDSVALFRLAVAAAVLPLAGWRARVATDEAEPVAVPFPVHIQALIGTATVLWLFRIVGLVWLGLAALHVAQRAGAQLTETSVISKTSVALGGIPNPPREP